MQPTTAGWICQSPDRRQSAPMTHRPLHRPEHGPIHQYRSVFSFLPARKLLLTVAVWNFSPWQQLHQRSAVSFLLPSYSMRHNRDNDRPSEANQSRTHGIHKQSLVLPTCQDPSHVPPLLSAWSENHDQTKSTHYLRVLFAIHPKFSCCLSTNCIIFCIATANHPQHPRSPAPYRPA